MKIKLEALILINLKKMLMMKRAKEVSIVIVKYMRERRPVGVVKCKFTLKISIEVGLKDFEF